MLICSYCKEAIEEQVVEIYWKDRRLRGEIELFHPECVWTGTLGKPAMIRADRTAKSFIKNYTRRRRAR